MSAKMRRHAVHNTLISELMILCEREVPDKDEPLQIPRGERWHKEGLEFRGREDLPPCTAEERAMIEHAGHAIKELLSSVARTSYQLI